MERKNFLRKVIFLSLFLISGIWLVNAFAVNEAKITAPDKSVNVSLKQGGHTNFYIEGWVCGHNLTPQVIHEIRSANEISREINNKIQQLMEGIAIIKTIVEEENKKNTPKKDIISRISPIGKALLLKSRKTELEITDFQGTRTLHAKDMYKDIEYYYINNYKKMVKEATKKRKTVTEYRQNPGSREYEFVEREIERGGGPEVLYYGGADTSLKKVKPGIEEIGDNYTTYTLSDCYMKSDFNVFMNNQIEAYQNAITLFSEYEKIIKELEDYINGKKW